MKLIFRSIVLTVQCVLACAALFSGCSDGDVRKASGNYEVTVVDPAGKSAVGSASVTNSGDVFSIVINSSVGRFAFTGQLVDDQINTTFTDSATGTVTALIQFSPDRSTFTGNIQTTSGLFVVRGIHL